jgi:hypothetical protein
MFWDLDTIATGVSPRDTLYPWVVPDTVLDAAWIVAITYGPGGWQFDASDEPFSIVPSGLAEKTRGELKPVAVRTPTVVGRMLLLPEWPKGAALLDVTGRRVIDLAPGETDVSHVSPGVYFVRREEDNTTTKVVIQR